MKHKAQEALDNTIDKGIIKKDYNIIQRLTICQLTEDEIDQIMNCLSVACFNSETYNSIFDKLKQQKEMWCEDE